MQEIKARDNQCCSEEEHGDLIEVSSEWEGFERIHTSKVIIKINDTIIGFV